VECGGDWSLIVLSCCRPIGGITSSNGTCSSPVPPQCNLSQCHLRPMIVNTPVTLHRAADVLGLSNRHASVPNWPTLPSTPREDPREDPLYSAHQAHSAQIPLQQNKPTPRHVHQPDEQLPRVLSRSGPDPWIPSEQRVNPRHRGPLPPIPEFFPEPILLQDQKVAIKQIVEEEVSRLMRERAWFRRPPIHHHWECSTCGATCSLPVECQACCSQVRPPSPDVRSGNDMVF
jgi:hypothetical protein